MVQSIISSSLKHRKSFCGKLRSENSGRLVYTSALHTCSSPHRGGQGILERQKIPGRWEGMEGEDLGLAGWRVERPTVTGQLYLHQRKQCWRSLLPQRCPRLISKAILSPCSQHPIPGHTLDVHQSGNKYIISSINQQLLFFHRAIIKLLQYKQYLHFILENFVAYFNIV